MPLPPSFTARLHRKRRLTPGVVELGFERTDGAAFVFDPGQWVSLALPVAAGDPEIRRAYSIASPPNGTAAFEIAVTRVEGGPGSQFLHDLPIGTVLQVIGPQGFFTRPGDFSAPSLFVGTGTGLTPLRSMIRAALAIGSETPLRLVYGSRREEDLVYKDEVDALVLAHPQLRAEYTLSRDGDAAWTGRRGYVQAHVKERWEELRALGRGAPHVYICGLQKMVGAVRELLKNELEVPRQQVHSERYD